MRTGSAGIAGAAFVLGAVLVAAPLYVASVGSAALQQQFDERCPGRIGLELPHTPAPRADAVLRATNRALEGARGVAPAVRTIVSTTPLPVTGLPVGVADDVRLLHRPGSSSDVEVLAGPDGEGLWIPDGWASHAGLAPGGMVSFATTPGEDGPPTPAYQLRVAAVYRDLATNRPPPAWCLQSDLLAPTPRGDPPPPLLLLDDATLARLPVPAFGSLDATDAVPVRRGGLTTTIAADLVVRFDAASDAAVSARLSAGDVVFGRIQATSDLPSVLNRADAIRRLVRVNVVPVQAAGAVAGTTLAVVAGLLAARRREIELRTRAVRGEGPVRLASRVTGSALPAAVAGIALGAVAAHLVVRAAGPSDDLGRVLGGLLRWSAAAVVLAVVGTAASSAIVVSRLVDARPRVAHHHRRRLAAVPFEWAVLALVVAAYRRLDAVGGAQFLGNETTSVDALALAFPMLAATGAAVVLARPVVLLARRLRRSGGRGDPAVLLAARRLAHDPTSAAAVAAAVALATATAVLGGTLSASAEEALQRKAATFVGGTAAANLAGRDRTLPDSLAGVATLTLENRTEARGLRTVVLGIDPATFGDGATTTAGDRELVARMAAADGARADSDPVPAIVVGPLGARTLDLAGGGRLTIDPIGHPATFPTSRNSSTLVVVPVDELAGARTLAVVIGSLDGPDLEARLRDAGRRVTGVVSVAEIITGTSTAAVRWAYAALRALGAVVVAVLLGVQLARSAARVRQRQLGEVFTSAMGLGRLRAVVAELVEHGLPMAVGLVVGMAVAIVAAQGAVPELDSARILPPAAEPLVPASTVALVVVVAGLTLVAVVAGGRRQAHRTPAAVVLRG